MYVTEKQFVPLSLSPLQLRCSFSFCSHLCYWHICFHGFQFVTAFSVEGLVLIHVIFFSYVWVWLQEWTQEEYLSSWKGYKHLTFGVMTTDSLYSILMTGMTSVWSTLKVDLVFWHHLHISMISEYELFPELLKIIAG